MRIRVSGHDSKDVRLVRFVNSQLRPASGLTEARIAGTTGTKFQLVDTYLVASSIYHSCTMSCGTH